jgi:hypothetical protein
MRGAEAEDLQLFQALCGEAARRCQADVSRFQDHVEAEIRRLPFLRRLSLRRTLRRMLRQQAAADRAARPSPLQ